MTQPIELSIIIPTYKRTMEPALLLDSIVQSHLSIPYEIIVVDQNDGLIDSLIEQYQAKLPIRHCKVSFLGVSKARNYGIDMANGRVICFPDDDAEFCDHTIMSALELLKRSNAECVFGKCVDKKSGEDSVIRFQTEETYLNFNNLDGTFVESTMFALTDLMRQYRYDEEMGVGTLFGSQEGYDLVYRMLSDGKKLYYSPDLIFFHPNKIADRRTAQAVNRAFYYSCGWSHLCKKHGLSKKFKKRLLKLTFGLPLIFIFKHRYLKYFKAQYLGLKLGYYYL